MKKFIKPFSWLSISLAVALLLLELLRGLGISISIASNSSSSGPSKDLLNRSQALLQRDAKLLSIKAAGQLDVILDPLFASYHNRVPDFAAWAFQWRTSYSLLRRGAITAITLPFSDHPGLQQFGDVWDDFIVEKFDELVLRPSGGELALHEARNNWEMGMYADLKDTMTDAILRLALLRGQDLALWTWQPVIADENSHKNDFSLFDAISSVTNPIKVHAVRPLLTRLTMRPAVAATVTVAGELFSSYGNFGFLGTVTGFAATVAGSLSIDYLISRIDAAVSQQDLEIEIHHVLDTEHEQMRRAWLAKMQSSIDTQIIITNEMLKKIF